MTADTTCPVCGQDNAPDGPGCACYGTPAPHYPTSADMAAFRADMLPLSLRRSGAPVCDPLVGGAWGSERREGIGHRCDIIGDPCDVRDARREASAMRSRAYQRMYGTGRAILDRNALRAFDELDTFEPRDRNGRGTPPRIWPR